LEKQQNKELVKFVTQQNDRLINLVAARGPLEYRALQEASSPGAIQPIDPVRYDPSDEAEYDRLHPSMPQMTTLDNGGDISDWRADFEFTSRNGDA
jgi:hypothetical protein